MFEYIIRNIRASEFLKGSIIVTLMGLLTNIGNYAFQLMNAQFLTKAEFGEFQALMAMLVIVSIPSNGINILISKYLSHSPRSQVKSLYYYLKKNITKYSLVFLVVFLVLSPLLKAYLNYESIYSIILIALIAFLTIYSLIPKSALLGFKNFFVSSTINVFEVVVKIILSFGVLYLGLGYNAVFVMIIFSIIFAIWLSTKYKLMLLEKIDGSEDHEIDNYETLKYFLIVCLGFLGLNGFFNLDVIIIKQFLTPEMVGEYGVLSLMGRIVLFSLISLGMVVMPFVSEKSSKNENTIIYLLYSIVLSFAIGTVILALFYFFPESLVELLFGNKYIGISNLVFLIGVGFFVYSLIYLVTQYYFAKHETWITYNLIFGMCMMIYIFWINTSSLEDAVYNFLYSVLITLGSIIFVILTRRIFYGKRV